MEAAEGGGGSSVDCGCAWCLIMMCGSDFPKPTVGIVQRQKSGFIPLGEG